MPERLVIANTSPLLYLHQVGQLELLRSLYRLVVAPSAVAQELETGGRLGAAVPDLKRLTWIEVRAAESAVLVPAINDLGPGEAEVIALGLENPGSLMILDD